MKKLATIVLLASLATTKVFAQDITLAKAVELACHRIERLVTLKKIDESFLKNLGTMSVVAQKPAQPTDAAFKVQGALYPGADGQSSQIEILMDAQGKTLSFNVIAGPSSMNAPVWPDQDSVSLVENSLHYVLDGWQNSNPNVKPFFTDLKGLRLSQVKGSAGQTLSKTEFWSNLVSTTLTVYLNTDGSFVSADLK